MASRDDLGFVALVLSFLAIYFAFYPLTYAIDDELNILSLAYSIAQGTVFLDQAGVDLDADLVLEGHRISKFSAFHAGLLAPAIATRWRLAFLVSAAFFVWGAFIFRDMLAREGLGSSWTILYFLNPGLLYYSRTLLAMVPAAVMGLLGASFLFRPRPRPFAGGMALGVAVLLHMWLAPVAILISLGWWLEHARGRARSALMLGLGALPAVGLLMLYNWMTTSSPIQNVYLLIGVQTAFKLGHAIEFLPFYGMSLLLVPPGGWAVLSRRCANGWTLPVTVTVVVFLASTYYYRDGANFGLAGWVPGQRFLLPVSLLACRPAARFLSGVQQRLRLARRTHILVWGVGAVALIAGFWLISSFHQEYLKAQVVIQSAVRAAIPDGARVIGNDRAFKAFAPVNGRWTLRVMRYGHMPDMRDRDGAYTVWLGLPGEQPPAAWIEGRSPSIARARSWVWSGDVWIAAPVRARHTDGVSAEGPGERPEI